MCACVYCKTTTVCCSDLFRDLNIFISWNYPLSGPGRVKNSARGLQERCWPPLVIRAAPAWPTNSKLRLSLFFAEIKLIYCFFLGRPWYCSYGPGVVIPQIACHGSSKDVRTLDVSEAALSKAAGNGMHLPSAGFVALVAMLCLTDLWLLQPPVEKHMLDKWELLRQNKMWFQKVHVFS